MPAAQQAALPFDEHYTEPGGRLYSESTQYVPLGTIPEQTVPLILLDQWAVVDANGQIVPWSDPRVISRPFSVDGTANGPFNEIPGLSPRVVSPEPTADDRDTGSLDLRLVGFPYPVPQMGSLSWRDSFYHLTVLRRQDIVATSRSTTPREEDHRMSFPGYERFARCIETSGRYYRSGWHTAISCVFEYGPRIAIVLHNPLEVVQADFESWIATQTPRLDLPLSSVIPYTWSEDLIAPPSFVHPLLAEFDRTRQLQGRGEEPMSLEEMQIWAAAWLVTLRGGPIELELDDEIYGGWDWEDDEGEL
ncbi:hypothetical protein CALVIDRAFT_565096 [Calocera viscosa TUFC12733]|uniref:Uncharacterized protein n=1 Tax=Calocera viscosa (strain TUFC12733) TaxID=1330018 RepID=A0A167KT74_CALVF|nr:hypothetical protein CALVIDRAFT_565096 [Calocera viscosa TUFC12733]